MPPKNLIPFVVTIILASLACSIQANEPQADPNAFNTMVAQTAQVQLLPPAQPLQPIQPTVAAPPTPIPPTQGPAVLVSTTINLPRHTALDLEIKAISSPLVNMELFNQNRPDFRYYQKAPAGSDIVFYAENPTAPDWEFLYPVNGTRMAFPEPTLSQVSYEGCVQAFKGGAIVVPGRENEAFPLDYYVFITAPGNYYCITTDKGNLGAFKLTAPGDYGTMTYVIIDYIVWNARLP